MELTIAAISAHALSPQSLEAVSRISPSAFSFPLSILSLAARRCVVARPAGESSFMLSCLSTFLEFPKPAKKT
jgi:hypothetical protein